MPNYVNKPGGVIVHLPDGTSEVKNYGDPIEPGDVAHYVDINAFSDSTPRVSSTDQALDRARDAARTAGLADGREVNSSASPVPSNYGDLDEDGAGLVVANLARFPEQQAAVIKHEILFGGNRRKVVDAAGEYAVLSANAQIAALLDTQKAQESPPTADKQGVTSPGDPLLGSFAGESAEHAAAYQARAAVALGAEALKSGEAPSLATPPTQPPTRLSEAPPANPSYPEGRTAEQILEAEKAARDALDEKDAEIAQLRAQLESPSAAPAGVPSDRHGGEAPVQDAPESFDGDGPGSEGYYTKDDLAKYAEQHQVEGVSKSAPRDEQLKALKAAGHDKPQTPKS
jgi:hypothetical protein